MTLIPSELAEAVADRYRLERELGQGGMATVYLARDLRHERDVAIKVLRPELAVVIGAERFLREIKTIATLQHPHILGLIDSGEVGGTAYYVMPFVEGESLRDRLTRERHLPIDDAVRLAKEVAGALDYAHRHGVIHRDIKPENILLHDGTALVADFGIALAVSAAGGTRMTETGMSLGTPHYMSPEQAMGEREITARSDVYALGCITYEMLTGEPPFTGPTAQAIVARVVTETPRPLTPQRHTVPPAVEAAVLAALEKLPADRFASAAEFARALDGRSDRPTVVRPAARAAGRSGSSRRLLAGTGLLAFLIGAAAAALLMRERATDAPRLYASVLPPRGCGYADVSLGAPQLSSDGARLLFVATCGAEQSLWIRSLATGAMERVDGTVGASYPFWSPDGASVGFFSGGMLKRADLGTKAVRNLAPAVAGRGGSWSPNGTIVYAPDIFGPMVRVGAAGGTPVPATRLAQAAPAGQRLTQRNPYFLPDGEHFLFDEGRDDGNLGVTRFGKLGSTDSRKLLDVASNVAFAEGRLLYVKDGVLVSQGFDPTSGVLAGATSALASGIETAPPRFLGDFTAAGTALLYREPVTPRSRIAWFEPASGREQPLIPEGQYAAAAVTPDRGRLLLSRSDDGSAGESLWLFDVAGGSWARVAGGTSQQYLFGWFPDGLRFFYLDNGSTQPLRIVRASDGTVVDTITRSQSAVYPLLTVAPDASYGLGSRQVEATGFDIMRVDLRTEGHAATPLLASPANEMQPSISPDGRLLGYLSDRSGRFELTATALPAASIEWQLSQDGAEAGDRTTIAWSADGRTLYYVDASSRLAAVDVSTAGGTRFGRPRLVAGAPPNIRSVSAASDGRLVLVVQAGSDQVPLTLTTGWRSAAPESK